MEAVGASRVSWDFLPQRTLFTPIRNPEAPATTRFSHLRTALSHSHAIPPTSDLADELEVTATAFDAGRCLPDVENPTPSSALR